MNYIREESKVIYTSYDGIVANIKFNSNRDRVDPPSTIFIMKNGDWVRY